MKTTRDATGAPDRRRRGLRRPDGQIAVLGAVLGAATLVALASLAAPGLRLPTSRVEYGYAAALMLAFMITEGHVIHIRVRRGSHAMSVSEIPMVLALLTFDPVLVVVGRVIGSAVGLLVFRRQWGLKLAFNAATLGAQSIVAVVVFLALTGDRPHAVPGLVDSALVDSGLMDSGRVDVGMWLAMYAAMLLSDVTSLIIVTAAIVLHDDPDEWRRLPSALRGVPLVAIATTIALVGSLAMHQNPWVTMLLVIVSVILFLAYRAFVEQSQGHAQVRELYAFTRALDGSSDIRDIARIVLEQARDQLRAETAELILPAAEGRRASRTRISGAGELITIPMERDQDLCAEDEWWTPALRGEAVLLRATSGGEPQADGMAVPVPWGDEHGALLVRNSLADIHTFDRDGLRLFQALANHASVSIANAALVDRLRREAEEKEYLALHDQLTDLPNRRHFQELLAEALAFSAAAEPRDGSPGPGWPAVIQLDLDRFKEINDALGHETGDSVLSEVGNRLRVRVGSQGRIARLGGDEFAVLLPRVHSTDEALVVATDLADALERPIQLGPLSLNARASIGVAVAPVHGDDARTLLRRADVAMYAAKDDRTGIRLYRPEDDQNTPHRLALITDLRAAIHRGDILVVFQPKLNPHTGMVIGAEALSRWHHQEHGNIPPDQFVPLAEHAGLVRPLTVHVLAVALRQCAAWRRLTGHDMHVAVNLSPSSLRDSDLPDVVSRLLSQAGLPASALTLEITESSLMEDQANSVATLTRLHDRGVRLSIDDFGTGYSSLGRLRYLPIDEVKIDKSFVRNVSTDHRDQAVVRSTVQLGHALNLEVVAEGVEDLEAYAYLSQEGCDVVQGYLMSKPLPPDDFVSWLMGPQALGWSTISGNTTGRGTAGRGTAGQNPRNQMGVRFMG